MRLTVAGSSSARVILRDCASCALGRHYHHHQIKCALRTCLELSATSCSEKGGTRTDDSAMNAEILTTARDGKIRIGS